MSIIANLFNLVLEVLVTTVREEKEIKHIQIGKEVVKLPLFANNDTICRNHEYAIKKLLELINEFIKVAKYNIMYRNLLHFHTLEMKYQKEKLRK